MKAIVFDGHQAKFIANHPQPKPLSNECLVRVELSCVCSTDLEILRGYRPSFQGVMGHEFVGLVEASSIPELIGQRVVGEINLSCGHCLYCLTGRPQHCADRSTLGINHKNGCFAEYLTLPSSLIWPVGEIKPERAVFCEPLAAALRITEQVSFPPAVPVAIIGDGRQAMMVCQALSASTEAELTVFGKHPEKLALFEPFANTSLVVEGSFETVIDASGSPDALKDAIKLTRSLGTLVIKSTYAGMAEINMSEVVVRELTIKGSRCGPFKPALKLLADERLSLPELEIHAPEDFQAAFDSTAFKAALDFRD
ncbi:MAG: alcohol dehydrogenase catalytic domain-containing protein [Actinomycetia bacterium]|nr:alcohol dehydrogenase catalytic domain-containing protein [Actinomycetes bacterium]